MESRGGQEVITNQSMYMRQFISPWLLTALLTFGTILSHAQTIDNDSLSLLFSRSFKHSGAPFTVQLTGTVSADGTPAMVVKNIKLLQKSSHRDGFDNWAFSAMNKRLRNDIPVWVRSHIILPQVFPATPESATPIEMRLSYFPLYYAQTGDTLYYRAYNKSVQRTDVTSTPFSIIDNRTPNNYLLVKRDEDELTLNYYDSAAVRPFYVERYRVQKPAKKVTREGVAAYLNHDGQAVMRHFYQNDTLQYSEKLNTKGLVMKKYFYDASTPTILHTHIQRTEISYSGGTIQHSFERDTIRSCYFDRQGQPLESIPSPDAAQQVAQWVADSLLLPVVGDTVLDIKTKKTTTIRVGNYVHTSTSFNRNRETGRFAVNPKGISRLQLQDTVVFHITEKGKMEYVPRRSSKSNVWSYEWDESVTPEKLVKLIVEEIYEPVRIEFMLKLQQAALHCSPATADGDPVQSYVVVPISKTFQQE